jgi:hypothetical protein
METMRLQANVYYSMVSSSLLLTLRRSFTTVHNINSDGSFKRITEVHWTVAWAWVDTDVQMLQVILGSGGALTPFAILRASSTRRRAASVFHARRERHGLHTLQSQPTTVTAPMQG